MAEEVEVVIVGAGIAGLATALALKRVGAKRVVVLERASELRVTGAALSLSPNAWQALAALGVAHKLNTLYPAYVQRGRVTNITTGATQEMTFGDPRSGAIGVKPVHRRVLLQSLADELPPDTVRFSIKIASIATEAPKDASSRVVLHLDDGTVISSKVLIGCDGVHSTVAHWLGLSAAVDSGRDGVRGLAVYPGGHGFSHEFHQFLSKSGRGGFIPINDKEIYWGITNRSNPRDKEMARDPELIQKHVTENLAKDFPPEYLDVVHHSDLSNLSWAPLLFRVPWDVFAGPTNKGNVTVAGDAMHPMTPDLGQGGCLALEDAVVLGRNFAACLRLDGSVDTGKAAGCLARYVKERRWRAARVAAGSYLSGWMQQGGSGWGEALIKFIRDSAFYRLLFPKMASSVVNYDCGNLPPAVTATAMN